MIRDVWPIRVSVAPTIGPNRARVDPRPVARGVRPTHMIPIVDAVSGRVSAT